jgi:ABC-type glycerol-3-phosphate transport system substrate-binding protein
MYDKSIAAQGFATQDFRSAQSQLLLGKAAFCPTGDWMFNEEIATYSEQIKDVAFIKVPIVSAVGTKLFGEGTKYNFSEDKCEQVLKLIAKAADQDKEVSQIKSEVDDALSVDIAIEDVQTVCERRGYMRDASSESAYISSKTTKKEVAFAFLRFLASKDCATLFSEEANTTSPFAVGAMDESYTWRKNVNEITNNRYFKQLISEARGYRLALGVTDMFYRKTYIASNIQEENLIIYNVKTLKIEGTRTNYVDKAKSYADAIYQDAKTNASSVWKIN